MGCREFVICVAALGIVINNEATTHFVSYITNIQEALGRNGSAGWVEPSLHTFRCLVEEAESATLVSPCVLMSVKTNTINKKTTTRTKKKLEFKLIPEHLHCARLFVHPIF